MPDTPVCAYPVRYDEDDRRPTDSPLLVKVPPVEWCLHPEDEHVAGLIAGGDTVCVECAKQKPLGPDRHPFGGPNGDQLAVRCLTCNGSGFVTLEDLPLPEGVRT